MNRWDEPLRLSWDRFLGRIGLPPPEQLADQFAIDSRPDCCWRCNVRFATDDIGLCESCREDLKTSSK